jgi:hypothetical protein
MKLTDEQNRILRHMLGIDLPDVKEPKPYRNYYCANCDDDQLAELARLGAVRLYSRRDGYDWYCCTDAGRAAAFASHKRIRLPKAKRIYSRFLDVKDALCDLTFREFLTAPEFAQTRRDA